MSRPLSHDKYMPYRSLFESIPQTWREDIVIEVKDDVSITGGDMIFPSQGLLYR